MKAIFKGSDRMKSKWPWWKALLVAIPAYGVLAGLLAVLPDYGALANLVGMGFNLGGAYHYEIDCELLQMLEQPDDTD